METPSALPPILFLGFLYYAVLGGWLDTALLIGFSIWRRRAELFDFDHDAIESAALAVPGIVFGFIVFQTIRVLITTLDGPKWEGPGKPLLIPCRTTHRRNFPEKHSFSYSYLTVGIPVDWAGTAGGMVSTGVRTKSGIFSLFSLKPVLRRGWYDVDPVDYLSREGPHDSLRGKLDAYLKSEVSGSISRRLVQEGC